VPHQQACHDALLGQIGPVEIDVLWVLDEEPAAGYDVRHPDHEGHSWSVQAMHRVGWLRQQLVERAELEGYDAVWLVDDDLVCAPDTLARLLRVDVPVVYGIFWTPSIDGSGVEMPQCWDVHHPYQASQEALDAWRRGWAVEVVGGGACTLLRREAWPTYRWWPPMPGLPHHELWQGEDRAACIRACAAIPPLRQVALGGLDITHLYRAQQREPEAVEAAVSAMRDRWVSRLG